MRASQASPSAGVCHVAQGRCCVTASSPLTTNRPGRSAGVTGRIVSRCEAIVDGVGSGMVGLRGWERRSGYDLSMPDSASDSSSAAADMGRNASVESMLALALDLVNAGQREQAKRVCARAPSAHPAVQQLLAVLDLQDGDVPGARRHAEASLGLRPGHVPTLLIAGQAQHACGAFRAAQQSFEQAVAGAPGDHAAWFHLALVRQDLRNLAGAESALRRVLQLAPGRADALVNLGIVLQDRGQLDAALQAYGRAYRLRDETFGRIAHALASANVGRLWLDLDALRATLRGAAA